MDSKKNIFRVNCWVNESIWLKSMKNNAINLPYLQTAGYILIGTGTTPIAGPLEGRMNVIVTPSGTAIQISSTSTLINQVSTSIWGDSEPALIVCNNISYCSSFFSVFSGTITSVSTFWFAVSNDIQYVISIWDWAGTTKLVETSPFTPTVGLYSWNTFSKAGALSAGTVFWLEMRPTSSSGNTWQVYGCTHGTQDLNFNRSLSGGGASQSPTTFTTTTQNRVWCILN